MNAPMIHCHCPLCGHPMPRKLVWESITRVFEADGRAVHLTCTEGRIFNALWHKRHFATLDDLAKYVYHDRADGGPENLNTLSIIMGRLRKKLERLGYTITRNTSDQIGWRLKKLEAA
jgi:hypothetical protein